MPDQGSKFATPTRCRWVGLLMLLAPLWACQAQPPLPQGIEAERALRQRIVTEIGEAACEHDSQCRTLAVGARACGGPERWMAWSVVSSRGERLEELSQALSAMVQARNERSGLMSTCVVVPDPGAVCRAGQCVIGQASRGANIR
jgi:hypothetical protein